VQPAKKSDLFFLQDKLIYQKAFHFIQNAVGGWGGGSPVCGLKFVIRIFNFDVFDLHASFNCLLIKIVCLSNGYNIIFCAMGHENWGRFFMYIVNRGRSAVVVGKFIGRASKKL